jgi:RNA polymerase sigma-70 factor (ECF subfamily)
MLSDTTTVTPAQSPDRVFRTELLPILTSSTMLRTARHLYKGDQSAAEDLVQVTSLRAWRYRGSYQPGTNARAWLNTIMRRAFLSAVEVADRDQLKIEFSLTSPSGGQHFVTNDVQINNLASADVEPESRIDAERAEAAAAAAIESALGTMPIPFRETWIAFERQHLSYAEIAETMGVAMGTVMSRLHRARAQIEAEFTRLSAAA